MSTLREEAEVLRLGLLMKVVQAGEVIAWADHLIADMPAPPLEIVDIALAARQPVDELARMLAAMPGECDFTRAAHRTLGILRDRKAAQGMSLAAMVDSLYIYAWAARVSDGERYKADWFSDEYALLMNGSAHTCNTPKALNAEVGLFLSEFAAEPQMDL